MKKSKKNYVIIALIVILLAIAIGYSAFSSTLKISGTATGTGDWSVIFTSATLKDSNGNEDATHGTVSFTGDTVTVNVELQYPGDAVLLETVISNEGSVPAKLTSITVTNENNDLIVTEATPTAGETLAAGGSCTSQFSIQWDPASEATELNATFTVTFEYEQDTENVTLTPTHSDI